MGGYYTKSERILQSYSSDTWEFGLDEFIGELRAAANKIGGDVAVVIDFERGWDDDGGSIEISVNRPETEEEKTAREAEERRANAIRFAEYQESIRQQELAMLAALKAKYET